MRSLPLVALLVLAAVVAAHASAGTHRHRGSHSLRGRVEQRSASESDAKLEALETQNALLMEMEKSMESKLEGIASAVEKIQRNAGANTQAPAVRPEDPEGQFAQMTAEEMTPTPPLHHREAMAFRRTGEAGDHHHGQVAPLHPEGYSPETQYRFEKCKRCKRKREMQKKMAQKFKRACAGCNGGVGGADAVVAPYIPPPQPNNNPQTYDPPLPEAPPIPGQYYPHYRAPMSCTDDDKPMLLVMHKAKDQHYCQQWGQAFPRRQAVADLDSLPV